MWKLILKLIVMQPQVLVTHAKKYAGLVTEGLEYILIACRLRLLLYALSAALFGLGSVCSAVALLLWAALPVLNPQHAWVLLMLPFSLFTASVLLFVTTKRYKMDPLFQSIREQFDLDMQAICQPYEKRKNSVSSQCAGAKQHLKPSAQR